jgi:hypothetical protein
MQKRRRALLTSLTFCTCLCCSVATSLQGTATFAGQMPSAADSSSDGAEQARQLQGQAAAFGVLSEDLQSKMGLRCTTNQNEDVVISDVTSGTAAAASNLKNGDHIVDAQVVGTALDITIERNGKFFKARLRAIRREAVLVAQKPMLDNTVRKPFTLGAAQNVERDNQLIPESASIAKQAPKTAQIDAKQFSLQADKNAKLISNYTLELLVDRSKSMQRQDCPGDLSRWQWCGQQAGQLAKSLAPFTPNGLTIIPFAGEYDVFEHATPQNIDIMFNNINLQSGTRLFEPLTERLDSYFAHRKPNSKPLLIVIVTDGIPSPRFEPALVKQTLIEASQKMKYENEVVVIFCQIGGQDRFGQRYLTDLDQNLMNYGAKYHFVHAIPFDELQEIGLGPALASQIKQYAPTLVQAPAPGKAAAKNNALNKNNTSNKNSTNSSSNNNNNNNNNSHHARASEKPTTLTLSPGVQR